MLMVYFFSASQGRGNVEIQPINVGPRSGSGYLLVLHVTYALGRSGHAARAKSMGYTKPWPAQKVVKKYG